MVGRGFFSGPSRHAYSVSYNGQLEEGFGQLPVVALNTCMARKRNNRVVIEPLPWIDVPRKHIEALGLDPEEGDMQAVFFDSGTPSLSNGKMTRAISAVQAKGLVEWLKSMGIRLGGKKDWRLVIVLSKAIGYVMTAEPAEATVQVQWADPSDSIPMEDFLRDYGGGQ